MADGPRPGAASMIDHVVVAQIDRSAAAARQRARRARQACGLIVLRVEVDEVETEEWLIAAGHLQRCHADDRTKVAAALGRCIRALVRHA